MDGMQIIDRSWYHNTIEEFAKSPNESIMGQLCYRSSFPPLDSQKHAWEQELYMLKTALWDLDGRIYLEFTIPRMGKRVDAIVLINGILMVIEFKVESEVYSSRDIDQVVDYAVDMKYFHEGSHSLSTIPILVATHAKEQPLGLTPHDRIQGLYRPVMANSWNLLHIVRSILALAKPASIEADDWEHSRYCPTPTIIEAARSLYQGHNVAEISRNDAGAKNLSATTDCIIDVIDLACAERKKAICFVTGVPGAGKTLVGLNIATKYNDSKSNLHSIFLSGNGPLVAILREALARDHVVREKQMERKITKKAALSRVQAFIQNVHHFRDECLKDRTRPPVDHVVLFDEAQRAWNLHQTSKFMKNKKGVHEFEQSEPEYLISCMDRRQDWAVIVCLVGGGQEINTGEAGISEWITALMKDQYHAWEVYVSPELIDKEYGAGKPLTMLEQRSRVHFCEDLHLNVSMRSFRAEKVSGFVKHLLDCQQEKAREELQMIQMNYPIAVTRDINKAKRWLRDKANGSERYGIIVSSQAYRLKPYAMDVRYQVDPVTWFLEGKEHVRSSYYLEDIATEFQVQGLELDWTCIAWDGDLRFCDNRWAHFSFKGSRWENVNKHERRIYQINAYRVLLTRARQGMILFVPEGDMDDPTRLPQFYNETYNYLVSMGLVEV